MNKKVLLVVALLSHFVFADQYATTQEEAVELCKKSNIAYYKSGKRKGYKLGLKAGKKYKCSLKYKKLQREIKSLKKQLKSKNFIIAQLKKHKKPLFDLKVYKVKQPDGKYKLVAEVKQLREPSLKELSKIPNKKSSTGAVLEKPKPKKILREEPKPKPKKSKGIETEVGTLYSLSYSNALWNYLENTKDVAYYKDGDMVYLIGDNDDINEIKEIFQ